MRFSLNGGDETDDQDDIPFPSDRRQQRKRLKLMFPSTTATTSASASASAPPRPRPRPQPPPPRRPLVLIQDEDEEDFEEDESEDAESYEEDDDSDEPFVDEPAPRANEQAATASASVDESDSYDDSKKLTLTLTDPDVLDCPICYENLKAPVFQCEHGHLACGSCCVKINNKCPSCSFPTGYNRCRAIEKVLEASQVSCKNTIYGCPTVMKYYIKQEHERRCYHSPCSCPECDFIDSTWNLYHHIEAKHQATKFRFAGSFSVTISEFQNYKLLREETLGAVFALKKFTSRQGSAVTIVQIAPKSHSEKYRYKLKTKDGETSLTLKSSVVCVPKLADYLPTKHYLLVDDFCDSFCRLTFDCCINPLEY